MRQVRARSAWLLALAGAIAACGAPPEEEPATKPGPVYTTGWRMCSQDHVAATPPGVEVTKAPGMLTLPLRKHGPLSARDRAAT